MTTALVEGSASRPGRSLPPGKDPVSIVQEAGWAPRPLWTGAENLAPTGIRSPDRLARSQSLYRLSYPAHYVKQMRPPDFESFNTAMRVVTLLWSLMYGFWRNMMPTYSVPSPEDRGSKFHRNVCAYPPNYTVTTTTRIFTIVTT